MRLAVVADVHGNLPALEAVLAEVDRLAELGERAVWVHGNGERGLVAGFDHATGPAPTGTAWRSGGYPPATGVTGWPACP